MNIIYRNTAGQNATFYKCRIDIPLPADGAKLYVDNAQDASIVGNAVLDFDGHSKIESARQRY